MAKDQSRTAQGDTAPLVRRWKAEGNGALQPLYERFRLDLRRFVQRIVGPTPPRGFELDDLLDEVWHEVCRIHGSELQLSNPGAFRALLRRIARNRIAAIYRTLCAQKRNHGEPDQTLDTRARREGTPINGPEHPPTPSRLAIANEIIERLRSSLSRRMFDVWYRIEEGYSPRELEGVLGLSERHIRRLHREGLKRLGKILSECDE